MKNFEEWKADLDEKVSMYDALIEQKKLELGALRAIRDSYAIASYPGGKLSRARYEPGMEDCGK
jgi:hypothetical protein